MIFRIPPDAEMLIMKPPDVCPVCGAYYRGECDNALCATVRDLRAEVAELKREVQRLLGAVWRDEPIKGAMK